MVGIIKICMRRTIRYLKKKLYSTYLYTFLRVLTDRRKNSQTIYNQVKHTPLRTRAYYYTRMTLHQAGNLLFHGQDIILNIQLKLCLENLNLFVNS